MNRKFTRREVVGLLGASLLLSACGSNNASLSASSSNETEPSQTTGQSELPEEIEVKVVDKVKESYGSYDIDDKWFETSYTYDEEGRLVQTETTDPFNISDENVKPGWKHAFEYDENGRIASVSWYAEYIEWGLSYTEEFTYNNDGTCATYDATIRSQGDGASSFAYTYSNDGLIESAVEVESSQTESHTSNLVWGYDDAGAIDKVTLTKSTGYGDYGIGLDDALSDKGAGVYTYRDTYGFSLTLRYDEDGFLVSSEKKRGSGWPERYEYSYKTITVKRSEWIPSIYSNPSGLDARFEPQVTAKRLAQIRAE